MIALGVETERTLIEDRLSTVPANISQRQFTRRAKWFTVASTLAGRLRIDELFAASATAERLLEIRSIFKLDCRSIVGMKRSIAFLIERNRAVVAQLERAACVEYVYVAISTVLLTLFGRRLICNCVVKVLDRKSVV